MGRRTEPFRLVTLLPAETNKLKLEWIGPYKVLRQVSRVDYEVATPGRRREKKVYHVNLQKKWNPASANPAMNFLAMVDEQNPDEPEASDLLSWNGDSGADCLDPQIPTG